MRTGTAYLTLSLLLGLPRLVPAAQTISDESAFLARARAASEKYKDQLLAIADGYRAIGPEAPAMGQHWLQPGLLVGARFDVDHPTILEYVTVQGQPVLAGVGYALPLGVGESPPDAPAGRAAWHSHAGGVEEEGVTLSHEDSHGEGDQERVAVLHAWVWIDNPAGPFVPLNWTLPYVRAGLDPRGASSAPAKALSLANGGTEFWETGLEHALDTDARGLAALHRVVGAYADTVGAWWTHRDAGTRLRAPDEAWLSGLWERLRGAVMGTLDAPARERAAMLSGF
ncbi:MAG TPA: hypothetical protein VFD76_07715 [Gemmatimonadales bacterium]|nr:hypothetical protein [Gemmatimonadales bacterium]HZI22389.1 hypothetical protein [Gemmatimonadales bacterium]